jgi:hypothetical protein
VVASDLTSIARRHSSQMASQRRIYHDDNLPNEVSGWRALGENVGRGSSADGVHDAFMDSSEHRGHILSSTYNQVGIGAVRGGDGLLYVTEVFAERGTVRRTTVVHRARARVSPRHAPQPARKPVKRLTPPDQAVGMLLQLLALDPADGVPKGMSPPVRAA